MRKINLIAAFCMLAAVACNNAGEGTAEADSSAHAMDHSSMTAGADSMPAIPEGARVYFANLKDGETVTSPVKVEMGVEGIGLDSAGMVRPASGHHHIIIDGPDFLEAGTVVPKDSTHLHFGNAQTETELTLTPGKHKLTLQYADGLHRSYGEKLSSSITIDVK